MVEETMDHKAPKNAQEPGQVADEPYPQEEEGQEEGRDQPLEEHLEDEKTAESLEDRLKAMEEALEQTQAESNKHRTDYLRALADMENLRKRTEREKENTRKFAVERFALDLLDVMDNVVRALDTLDAGVEVGQENGTSVQSVIQGVQMIQSEFEKTFTKNGITRIKSMQEPFDPNFHQAVQQVQAEDVKSGTVVQEMRAGYLLNERLLRPSMVAVSQ